MRRLAAATVAAAALLALTATPALADGYAGAMDESFGSNGLAGDSAAGIPGFFWTVGTDRSGRIVAGGSQQGMVASWMRFTTAGAVDSSYGQGGIAIPAAGQGMTGAVVLPGGRAVGQIEFNASLRLVRQSASGRIDSSFGCLAGTPSCPGYSQIGWQGVGRTLEQLPGGRYIAVGRDPGGQQFSVNLIGSDGVLARQFRAIPGMSEASAVVRTPKGRRLVVLGSTRPDSGGRQNVVVARYLMNGRLDRTFGCEQQRGCPGTMALPRAVVGMQTMGGDITVRGRHLWLSAMSGPQTRTRLTLWRINAAGTVARRAQAGPAGVLVTNQNLVVDRAGRFVVSGATNDGATGQALVVRWRGRQLDTSFGCARPGRCSGSVQPYPGSASAIALDRRGRYLLAGNLMTSGRAVVARVLAGR